MVSQYMHSNKAGNIGDVWKHFALARILNSNLSFGCEFYLETHCGNGIYSLSAENKAERGKGIYRIVDKDEFKEEPFIKIMRKLNPNMKLPGDYPGSVYTAKNSLELSADRFILFDINKDSASSIKKELGLNVLVQNWIDGLKDKIEYIKHKRGVIFLDPPYRNKDDWNIIPDFISKYIKYIPEMVWIVWYPVFAYTKPNKLFEKCKYSFLPVWRVECIVDKPKSKPSRKLKGSGILVIGSWNTNIYTDLLYLAKKLAFTMSLPNENPEVRMNVANSY